MVRPLDGWDHRRRAVQRVAPAPGGLPETGPGDHAVAGGPRLRAHPQPGGADGGEPDPPGAGAPAVRGAALGPGGPHGEGRMTKNRRGNDQGMRPEVRVVGDVTSAALDLFLDESPATFLLTGGSTPEALYERM